MKPLAVDLCCGLGGWTHALLQDGWDVIGYDIEKHEYGNDKYPGRLIIQDIRTIDGTQFRGKVSLIVASPPCTEYSYMAMPWKRAKQIRAALLGKGEFPEGYKGSRTVSKLNELFNHCVRIGQEAGCPIIIENVRGAQEWVGKAKWFFGSFGLWGDVPALMPIPGKVRKTPEGSLDQTRTNYNADHAWKREGIKAGDRNPNGTGWSHSFADTLKGEGSKSAGMNWSNPNTFGKNVLGLPNRKKGVSFTDAAGFLAEGVKQPSAQGQRTDVGNGARFTSRFNRATGKVVAGGIGDASDYSSKSSARKQVSAEIAKIPPALAQWIARVFKPDSSRPS